MYTLFITIHLLSCFILIGVVLLQSGKGAEIGAAFGGSSQTLFGSRGAATFLSKVTAVTAVVFLVTAMSLAVMSKERSIASSVLQHQPSEPAGVEETGPGEQPVSPAPGTGTHDSTNPAGNP